MRRVRRHRRVGRRNRRGRNLDRPLRPDRAGCDDAALERHRRPTPHPPASTESIEAHGGSIRALNRDGGGLCVAIMLPINELF